MERRDWLLKTAAMVGAGVAAPAGAAAPRRLVLMSVVGDELTVVGEHDSLGSKFNQNKRSQTQLKPGVLDTAIVKLMRGIVLRREANAVTTLVAPTEETLFKGHDLWFYGEST